MLKSEARIATPAARKYLVQLCKHFRHKVPAEYDDSQGRVDFQPGDCLMTASEDQLIIHCEGEDEFTMLRMKKILEQHLQQFAWREDLAIEWTAIQEGASSEPLSGH